MQKPGDITVLINFFKGLFAYSYLYVYVCAYMHLCVPHVSAQWGQRVLDSLELELQVYVSLAVVTENPAQVLLKSNKCS